MKQLIRRWRGNQCLNAKCPHKANVGNWNYHIQGAYNESGHSLMHYCEKTTTLKKNFFLLNASFNLCNYKWKLFFFRHFFPSFLVKIVHQENWWSAGIGNHIRLLEVILEAAPGEAAAGRVFASWPVRIQPTYKKI